MEKSDAIRRAVRRMPVPELPEGFTGRLMERVQRETRRHERRETCLLAIGGIACFAALAAVCRWVLFPRLGIGPLISGSDWRMPSIRITGEELSAALMWGYIALTALVLLLADLLIRRRAAASRN